MRNVKDQVEQGQEIIRKHNRASLMTDEIEQLLKPLKDNGDATRAVLNAFYMGVAVGSRNG
jgi:hypothetical protein